MKYVRDAADDFRHILCEDVAKHGIAYLNAFDYRKRGQSKRETLRDAGYASLKFAARRRLHGRRVAGGRPLSARRQPVSVAAVQLVFPSA